MIKQIDWIADTRQYLLHLVKNLSVEQLNYIPPGFNNNIIWNLAHLVAVQQGICYVRSGLAPVVDEKYVRMYTRGTKPEEPVGEDEVNLFKDLMISTLDLFKRDYNNGLFVNYTPFTTTYGVELTSINDAIQFLQFHEGLHFGSVLALRKLVPGV